MLVLKHFQISKNDLQSIEDISNPTVNLDPLLIVPSMAIWSDEEARSGQFWF